MASDITPSSPPRAFHGLNRLSTWRQLGLMFGLAASIAVGGAVALWSQQPNYTLLFASLSGKEVTDVLDGLESAGIPFKVEEVTGAILVPSAKVHEARLMLARQGLPRGAGQGFEILNTKPSFGTSEFVERARYQRALEVELARSIATLNNVHSARVHIAIPKQTAFVRTKKRPTASVLTRLYSGRDLDPGQADTIAHLVAAAVPNMEPSEVRVIDDQGRLLTTPNKDEHAGLSDREFDYNRKVESVYVKRIEDILSAILGVGAFQAQVAADLDFTRTEQTQESFDPDPEALRSEQIDVQSVAEPEAAGIPGALSNQPPAASSVPEIAGGTLAAELNAGEADTASERKQRERATRNFELDRTINHVSFESGTVRRLSVAVVVDDRYTVGENGERVAEPRTDEEMERLTSLVKEAVGFNEERGDSVIVLNTPFSSPPAIEPIPELPIWKQPWVWDVAKQAGGVLFVLLLVFGVLRPMMRNLVARETVERELQLTQQNAQLTGAQAEGNEAGIDVNGLQNPATARQLSNDNSIDAIKTLVSEDPKRAANVVRNWVAADG